LGLTEQHQRPVVASERRGIERAEHTAMTLFKPSVRSASRFDASILFVSSIPAAVNTAPLSKYRPAPPPLPDAKESCSLVRMVSSARFRKSRAQSSLRLVQDLESVLYLERQGREIKGVSDNRTLSLTIPSSRPPAISSIVP